MFSFTRRKNRLLAGAAPVALAAALLFQGIVTTPAMATTEGAQWTPQASERLIRLPTVYLERTIDRDFQSSGLAAAIRDRTDGLAMTQQTIIEIQDALELADGDVRIELQHQLLAHKQQFVQLMGARLDLQRREAETRMRLYSRLLERIEAESAAMTPEREALIEAQELARNRFESVIGDVDMQVFGSGAEVSRYSEEYAENRLAIEALAARIDAHPMNQLPVFDGEAMDRETYLRRLVEDSHTTLALLDQEEEILGYMGKLVALDAMALHEEIAEQNAIEMGIDPEDAGVDVSEAASIFLN